MKKEVSGCIEAIERIQKSMWAEGDLEFLDRLDDNEIPVWWAMSPSSPPPPYWLNQIVLDDIKRELSVTNMIWGVRMAFCPFVVHNYDNDAIMRAAVTAENIAKEFDRNVFLDGAAHWTELSAASPLISVDQRKELSQYIVRLHFNLRFGIQLQRPIPYC